MYIEHLPHAWHQASCLEYIDEWDTHLPLKNLWFGNQEGKGDCYTLTCFRESAMLLFPSQEQQATSRLIRRQPWALQHHNTPSHHPHRVGSGKVGQSDFSAKKCMIRPIRSELDSTSVKEANEWREYVVMHSCCPVPEVDQILKALPDIYCSTDYFPEILLWPAGIWNKHCFWCELIRLASVAWK